MTSLVFRSAGPADSERIAELHTASWRDAYAGILPDTYLCGPVSAERAALWRERLSGGETDRQYVRLAEDGQTLAAFVCVLLDEEPGWGACIDNLHTAAAFRGRGIGRRLMRMAAEWVLEAEPGWPIHLWVFAANSGARRFYDALKGKIVEARSKGGPWGVEIFSQRYFWDDLPALIRRLSHDGRCFS